MLVNDLEGHSSSTKMAWLDRPYITSYYGSIVTMSLLHCFQHYHITSSTMHTTAWDLEVLQFYWQLKLQAIYTFWFMCKHIIVNTTIFPKVGGWWWALVSPDGVAPSQIVCVSASVNLHLHHKSRSFLLAPAHPGGPRKSGIKQLWCVVVVWDFERLQTAKVTSNIIQGHWHWCYSCDFLLVFFHF